MSVSSPLSTLDNCDIANFASDTPRSLSNSASASAVLPCCMTTERSDQGLSKDEELKRCRDEQIRNFRALHIALLINKNQELTTSLT